MFVPMTTLFTCTRAKGIPSKQKKLLQHYKYLNYEALKSFFIFLDISMSQTIFILNNFFLEQIIYRKQYVIFKLYFYY